MTEQREHTTPRGAGLARRARVLLGCYAVVLAAVLLSPSARLQTASVHHVGDLLRVFLPDGWVDSGHVEVLLNVLIVAPVAFLGSIVWSRSRWQQWTAYAFIGAVCVELVQGVLLPDRTASFSDIVANTAGALLGALLALRLHR